MNRGCKYTSKEIINMISWIYTTYIIMCDLMFIEKLVFPLPEKKVVSITVKKLEIKYLSNNIISVVYYIFMLYIKTNDVQ